MKHLNQIKFTMYNLFMIFFIFYFFFLFKNKSFVHVSTAYSNCAGRKEVDEIFYKTPISGDNLANLVNSLDDEYINKITPS